MSTNLNSLFNINIISRSQYIVIIIEHNDLISDINNFNVNNESFSFDFFERSLYEVIRYNNVTQRRRTRKSIFHSIFNY